MNRSLRQALIVWAMGLGLGASPQIGAHAAQPPAAGQRKALQGEMTLQPGQTVSGYLFYPAGQYTSARTTLVDKETDEGEGFSIQF